MATNHNEEKIDKRDLFYSLVIGEAKKAFELGEVPVACLIERDGEILSLAHNQKEGLKDPSCHGEVLAIREACKKVNNWRLNGANLYVSLEPCPMCMSLITQCRISKVTIYSPSFLMGACGTVLDLTTDPASGYSPEVFWDIKEEACKLMEDFFIRKRKEDEID